MKHFYAITSLFFFFTINLTFAQTTAVYNIEFTSVWNSTDHGTLPGGAHWSSLVGANHTSDVTFLEMGGIATDGIEDVAELGVNVEFKNEVDASISNGDTEQYIDGGGLGSATGTVTINNLNVSEEFPLLTLVSMIAPSPDWVIAVNSIELRESGSWKSSIVIDLYPYDAGTDSGTGYTSSNDDTNPREPISSLQNVAPFGNEKIGTLTITLNSVLGLENPSLEEHLKLFPNPTSGDFNVNISSPNISVKQIQILNSLGTIVNEFTYNKSNSKPISINTEDLSSGLYLVKLTTEDLQTTIKKIVVK